MAPAANDDYDPIPSRRALAPAALAFVGLVAVSAPSILALGFWLGWLAGKGVL